MYDTRAPLPPADLDGVFRLFSAPQNDRKNTDDPNALGVLTNKIPSPTFQALCL